MEFLINHFTKHLLSMKQCSHVRNVSLPKDFHKQFSSKEDLCKQIFLQRYGIKMAKTRPIFLKFKETKGRLEFDGYNASVQTKKGKGLAFEYNGPQHYFINYQNKYSFGKLLSVHRHDRLKNDYCKRHGIALITIPYNIDKSRIVDYIHKQMIPLFDI
uniref:Restriction-fold (UvrB-like) nuclease n=1 Tax=Carcinus maenas virus 1 TaxID=2704945 RepID=A0A6G9HDH0_9VIRU|nr:restriction-fold (UvrB-like) nuclease [Carcinus maenas virus 1]